MQSVARNWGSLVARLTSSLHEAFPNFRIFERAMLAAEARRAERDGRAFAKSIIHDQWSETPLPLVIFSGSVLTILLDRDLVEKTVIQANSCAWYRLRVIDDQLFDQHPMRGRGLAFWEGHEIIGQGLELDYPMSPFSPASHWRFYLLLFHDHSIEVVAKSLTSRRTRISTEALLGSIGQDSI